MHCYQEEPQSHDGALLLGHRCWYRLDLKPKCTVEDVGSTPTCSTYQRLYPDPMPPSAAIITITAAITPTITGSPSATHTQYASAASRIPIRIAIIYSVHLLRLVLQDLVVLWARSVQLVREDPEALVGQLGLVSLAHLVVL